MGDGLQEKKDGQAQGAVVHGEKDHEIDTRQRRLLARVYELILDWDLPDCQAATIGKRARKTRVG